MLLDSEKLKALDALPLVEAEAAIKAEVDALKEEMSAWRAYRAARVAAALEVPVSDGAGGERARKPVELARELGVDPAVVGKLRKEHLERQQAAAR